MKTITIFLFSLFALFANALEIPYITQDMENNMNDPKFIRGILIDEYFSNCQIDQKMEAPDVLLGIDPYDTLQNPLLCFERVFDMSSNEFLTAAKDNFESCEFKKELYALLKLNKTQFFEETMSTNVVTLSVNLHKHLCTSYVQLFKMIDYIKLPTSQYSNTLQKGKVISSILNSLSFPLDYYLKNIRYFPVRQSLKIKSFQEEVKSETKLSCFRRIALEELYNLKETVPEYVEEDLHDKEVVEKNIQISERVLKALNILSDRFLEMSKSTRLPSLRTLSMSDDKICVTDESLDQFVVILNRTTQFLVRNKECFNDENCNTQFNESFNNAFDTLRLLDLV